MKQSLTKAFIIALPLTLLSLSCSKKSNNDVSDTVETRKAILLNISTTVCTQSYEDMYAKTLELQTAVTDLNSATTDANLATARTKWKTIRTTWEQTEAWLFGPVEANNIDPRIDTWPVDFNALETILKNSDALTDSYVDGLDESLKGFHPIEYLLWGQNGTKTAATFTPREKQFLVALTQNLVKLTKEVRDVWTTGGYQAQLATAGSGSTEFTSQQAAFTQIADGMAGICDEVANGKIKEPFDAQDAKLEESPFAKNSITDFTNNINGILAVYQGRFIGDGQGLEDFVRAHNLSLDAELKSKHAAAIASLNAITIPFGEAIVTQQSKVQNAMTKINELNDVIEGQLKPLILQYVK